MSLQGQWLILPSDCHVSLQDVAGNALRFWRPPCLLKRCTECSKVIGTLVLAYLRNGNAIIRTFCPYSAEKLI